MCPSARKWELHYIGPISEFRGIRTSLRDIIIVIVIVVITITTFDSIIYILYGRKMPQQFIDILMSW